MNNSLSSVISPAQGARQEPRFPMPLPFGWYSAVYSDELAIGQSMPFRIGGRELVLFRTESGRAVALDAYCPHLGAHLGYGINSETGQGGRVQGESIVCPFHAWRFDPEGQCVEVPYAENMPPKIVGRQCLKAWSVTERNQVVYIWYHPEDVAPFWEVPAFEEPDDAQWSGTQRFEWMIHTHPQEMAENGADPAHFLYVHRTASMPKWQIEYKGHTAKGMNEAKMMTPRGEIDGSIANASFGPGVNTTRFRGICETFLMGMPLPVEQDLVRIRFAFFQRNDDRDSAVARALIADIYKQMGEDSPIWENKIYRSKPILCDGDGPIAKFRKWYSQFYVGTQPAAVAASA